MQGVWKEKINGWNKDNKRKKQSRKHTLKDKAKILIRKFYHQDIDNDSIRRECRKYFDITKKDIKKSEDSFICRVEFKYYLDRNKKKYHRAIYEPRRYFTRICYQLKYKWYDVYTNEEIIFDEHHILFKFEKIHIRYKEPLIVSEDSISLDRFYYDNTVFIYGNPLPNKFYKMYGFYSTTLKKFYKKVSHTRTRRNERVWLYKKDYDMDYEIKKSAIEKSYKWYID